MYLNILATLITLKNLKALRAFIAPRFQINIISSITPYTTTMKSITFIKSLKYLIFKAANFNTNSIRKIRVNMKLETSIILVNVSLYS